MLAKRIIAMCFLKGDMFVSYHYFSQWPNI